MVSLDRAVNRFRDEKHTYECYKIGLVLFWFDVLRESKKKQDTKLLPITSPNVNRFSIFFTDKLNGKFAIKSCLNIPPHLKHVATLATCQKTDNNLKYVFRLMTNHEIAQPSI